MPKIQVAKAFSLLLSPTDKPVPFAVGRHDVSDEVANHWYTKEHLHKEEEAPAAIDANTASREELSNYLRGSFEAHLGTMEDDALRAFAKYQIDRDLRLAADPDEAEGAETETETDPADTIQGGAGNDTISGTGSETATTASDTLSGGQGNDSLSGTAGADTAEQADAKDSVSGGAGNDAVDQSQQKKTKGRSQGGGEA